MADELDEGLLDELPCLRVGGEHVHDAVVGEHDAQAEDEEGLLDDVTPSKSCIKNNEPKDAQLAVLILIEF